MNSLKRKTGWSGELDEAEREEAAREVPLNKLGSPDDSARLLVFLASWD